MVKKAKSVVLYRSMFHSAGINKSVVAETNDIVNTTAKIGTEKRYAPFLGTARRPAAARQIFFFVSGSQRFTLGYSCFHALGVRYTDECSPVPHGRISIEDGAQQRLYREFAIAGKHFGAAEGGCAPR